MNSKYEASLLIRRILIYTFLIIFAIICIVPFYIMIINSTRSTADIYHGLSIFPGTYIFKNMKSLNQRQDVLRILFNSIFISVSVTTLTCYFSALTAYGFQVYRFKGRRLLFNIFVFAVILIPQQLSLIGFYDLCRRLNLLDTYWPLILPSIASPLSVFFIKQYMGQVINESIIQAGRIDGANELGIFHKLVLPIVMPGVATSAIFAFIGSWNNYLNAMMIINSEEKSTLPMMIAELKTETWRTDFGVLYLAVAISVIPILIIFVSLSKKILETVAIGGNKE